MKDPLGVSPSKGNQGTTRGKGKNKKQNKTKKKIIFSLPRVVP